jgi:hypothetical protein
LAETPLEPRLESAALKHYGNKYDKHLLFANVERCFSRDCCERWQCCRNYFTFHLLVDNLNDLAAMPTHVRSQSLLTGLFANGGQFTIPARSQSLLRHPTAPALPAAACIVVCRIAFAVFNGISLSHASEIHKHFENGVRAYGAQGFDARRLPSASPSVRDLRRDWARQFVSQSVPLMAECLPWRAADEQGHRHWQAFKPTTKLSIHQTYVKFCRSKAVAYVVDKGNDPASTDAPHEFDPLSLRAFTTVLFDAFPHLRLGRRHNLAECDICTAISENWARSAFDDSSRQALSNALEQHIRLVMVGRSLTRRSLLVGSAHADEFVYIVSDKCGEFHVPSFTTTPKSAEHVLRASVQVIGTVRSSSVHAPYTQHLLLKPSCLFAFYPSSHVNYVASRDDMGRPPQAADFALYCLLLVILDIHQARRKAGITTKLNFLELMHDLPTAEVWN